MRLSHKHKFVFICIPKTASTSLRKILSKYSDIRGGSVHPSHGIHYIHAKSETLEHYFKKHKLCWDKYIKFSFCRNPWDRTVSAYSYLTTNRGTRSWRDVYLKGTSSFKDYILNGNPYPTQLEHINTQDPMLFVGKFENIQADFDIICDKIGIPREQIPHTNRTKHKHYTEHYDDETREIVAEKYARDIEYFGYEFGE